MLQIANYDIEIDDFLKNAKNPSNREIAKDDGGEVGEKVGGGGEGGEVGGQLKNQKLFFKNLFL